jgi:hypothetical protein
MFDDDMLLYIQLIERSAWFSLSLCFQNLCVTAAHYPIREILEKEKKVHNVVSFLLFISLFAV